MQAVDYIAPVPGVGSSRAAPLGHLFSLGGYMHTVAIEVTANIAEFAAMKGLSFVHALLMAKTGHYHSMLASIHRVRKS